MEDVRFINGMGELLFVFSAPVGVRESNEAEILAMKESLRIYGGRLPRPLY